MNIYLTAFLLRGEFNHLPKGQSAFSEKMLLVQQWPNCLQETSMYNDWYDECYLYFASFSMVVIGSSDSFWALRYGCSKVEDNSWLWKYLLYNNGRNVGRKRRIITNEYSFISSVQCSFEWCWFCLCSLSRSKVVADWKRKMVFSFFENDSCTTMAETSSGNVGL